jgi:hypothetical protein
MIPVASRSSSRTNFPGKNSQSTKYFRGTNSVLGIHSELFPSCHVTRTWVWVAVTLAHSSSAFPVPDSAHSEILERSSSWSGTTFVRVPDSCFSSAPPTSSSTRRPAPAASPCPLPFPFPLPFALPLPLPPFPPFTAPPPPPPPPPPIAFDRSMK